MKFDPVHDLKIGFLVGVSAALVGSIFSFIFGFDGVILGYVNIPVAAEKFETGQQLLYFVLLLIYTVIMGYISKVIVSKIK